MKIQIKFKDDEPWVSGTILSRSGKATGKYANEYNVKIEDNIKQINFDRDILEVKSDSYEPSLENVAEIEDKNVETINDAPLILNNDQFDGEEEHIYFSNAFYAELNDEALKAKEKELKD